MKADTGTLSAPLTVNWTLSYRCNFGCQHCYSREQKEDRLSVGNIRKAVNILADQGVVFVNFGGGEPLVYPGLHSAASYASGCGLKVSMNSNGYLLDAREAQRITESGFTSVGISIDSPESQTHDRLRNMPGSFDKAVAALDHLGDVNIRCTVSCVINKLNRDSWRDMIELCRDHGVSALYLHNYKCSGEGAGSRDELDLSPTQWRDFYSEALEVQTEVDDVKLSFDDPIMASLEGYVSESAVPGSTCGKLSLHIKPNGDVTPCGFIPVAIGNIIKDEFSSIWFDSPVLQMMRSRTPRGKCEGCECYSSCLGGCTARVWATTGSFDNPDPHCWIRDKEDPHR